MDSLLNSAIEALRETSANAGLSDVVRAKIVQASWAESADRAETYRPVMRPLRWLVLAGVIPVALLVVAAILPRPADLSRTGAAFVGAEKLDGAVVFTIADGRGPHRVVRSTDAARFNGAASQRVRDGRFLDQANSGPVVVFYRID
jgi:hypothetical protein